MQLARGLGLEGYGQYAIAMAVISISGIPGEFGLTRIVTREVAAASARNDMPRLFGVISWANRTAIFLSIGVATAACAGAFLLVRDDGKPVASAIAIGAFVIPMVTLTKIRGAALQGLRFIVLSQLPTELLRPALMSLLLFVLFFMLPEANVQEAMALNVVTAAFALLLAHVLLHRRLPRPDPKVRENHGRAWLRSAIPIGLTDGMRLMRTQLAILFLGIVVSASEVGLFRTAVSIATIIGLPTVLVANSTLPVVIALHANGESGQLQRVAKWAARAQFLGICLLSLPLLLSAEPIIRAVYGAEFENSATALRILCLSILGSSAFGLSASILTMTGHERKVTRAMLLSLIAAVVTMAIFVPLWGEVGAAYSTGLSMIVWNGLTWSDARKSLNLNTSIFSTRKR